MISSNKIILLYTIQAVVKPACSLSELPPDKDNGIITTEKIIRDTTNKLFNILNLNTATRYPRLKQYSAVHNYLTTLTLQDYGSLIRIKTYSRNGKTNSNETEELVDIINEILNEDIPEYDAVKEKLAASNREHVEIYVDTSLNRLEKLKEYFGVNKRSEKLNSDLLKIFNDRISSSESDEVLGENDFWEGYNETAPTRRIFRGKRVKVKHYPFVASIHIFSQFQCIGSIISRDIIITAASCLQLAYNNRFFRENPAFLSVRVGSSYYGWGGEVIPILEVYFHPSYNPTTLKHNVCLIRLLRILKFKKKEKNLKMIKFDRNPHGLPYVTPSITILGWGGRDTTNKIYDPMTNMLAHEALDFYPRKECQEIYSKAYVTEYNFCAGFMSRGGGACNHDVGAPGVVNGILTGVASFGSPLCGTPDTPTVFVKLGYYHEWIDDIIKEDRPRGSVRTTKEIAPYRTATHTPGTTSRGAVTPIEGHHRPPMIYDVDVLRQGDYDSTLDKKLKFEKKVKSFKDFMKTMFDENELEEYKDLLSVLDNKGKGVKKNKTKDDENDKNMLRMTVSTARPYYDSSMEAEKPATKLAEAEAEVEAETEDPESDVSSLSSESQSVSIELPEDILREIKVNSETKAPETVRNAEDDARSLQLLIESKNKEKSNTKTLATTFLVKDVTPYTPFEDTTLKVIIEVPDVDVAKVNQPVIGAHKAIASVSMENIKHMREKVGTLNEKKIQRDALEAAVVSLEKEGFDAKLLAKLTGKENKTDDTVLTLLYLSDDEKHNDKEHVEVKLSTLNDFKLRNNNDTTSSDEFYDLLTKNDIYDLLAEVVAGE